jgi:hypothetical protein
LVDAFQFRNEYMPTGSITGMLEQVMSLQLLMMTMTLASMLTMDFDVDQPPQPSSPSHPPLLKSHARAGCAARAQALLHADASVRERGAGRSSEYGAPATRHTSHVTRHTSHVTRHTSHATRHTSHVTRRTSHVTRHTSHVTRHTSHVTRHRCATRSSSSLLLGLAAALATTPGSTGFTSLLSTPTPDHSRI